MNSNIDDWLSSLGLNESERPSSTPPVPLEPGQWEPAVPSEEPTVQSLSEDDFNDILSDLGFQETQDLQEIQEAEEVVEEDTTVTEEQEPTEASLRERAIRERTVREIYAAHNIPFPEHTTPQDLDAEEDADWQEAIDSGRIVPVQEEPEETAVVSSVSPEESTPLIPPNSPTLLVDETTSRFSGTEWYNQIQSADVILAGLGGIGSNAALQIARLHPHHLVLYDDDRVERGNMSGQLFDNNHVGQYKVDAVGNIIGGFTSFYNYRCLRQRWAETSAAGDIMICGFDNMEARKTFFNSWWRHLLSLSEERRKACLFIDGRLSIDTLQVLCIQGNDLNNIERYRKEFLFSDSEADETICSMKQTTYMACMIGAVITNLFTNFIAGTLDPIIPYDLPFFTEYNAQYMYFKTEH